MKNRSRVVKMVLCALFTALIIVGAFLQINIIPSLPITLQYAFTTLAGLVLGYGWGTASVGVYILMGLIGIPVFTKGGGIGYFAVPSFGFIIGFLFNTFLTGWIAYHKQENPSVPRLILAVFAGLVAGYIIGILYMNMLLPDTSLGALIVTNIPFALKDAVLGVIFALVSKKLVPFINKI